MAAQELPLFAFYILNGNKNTMKKNSQQLYTG
jgi:hypothetical protein